MNRTQTNSIATDTPVSPRHARNGRLPSVAQILRTCGKTIAAATAGALALVAGICHLQAQPITVPNFSFESPTAPNAYPFVNMFVDAWQKAAEPAYYGPAIGTPYGIPWVGTAGVFLDVNPYVNHAGTQAGYLLAFPEVTLFQDYNSTAAHDFDAVYEVGKSYTLTIGVFGKDTLAPGSTLLLSLYYLDALDNKTAVSSTTVSYSAAAFPTTAPLSLVDYSVIVPTVQAGDAWAGKHIGIQLESTTPLAMSTGGNWDFDNVRLAAIPEPASVSLLLLGAGGLARLRSRHQR